MKRTPVTIYTRGGHIITFTCDSIRVNHNQAGEITSVDYKNADIHLIVALSDIEAITFPVEGM